MAGGYAISSEMNQRITATDVKVATIPSCTRIAPARSLRWPVLMAGWKGVEPLNPALDIWLLIRMDETQINASSLPWSELSLRAPPQRRKTTRPVRWCRRQRKRQHRTLCAFLANPFSSDSLVWPRCTDRSIDISCQRQYTEAFTKCWKSVSKIDAIGEPLF